MEHPPPYTTGGSHYNVVTEAPSAISGMASGGPGTTTAVMTPATGPGKDGKPAGPPPVVLYEHAAGSGMMSPCIEFQFGRPREGRMFRWCCCECNLHGCCNVLYYMGGCCLWEKTFCYRHLCVYNCFRCSFASGCSDCCCGDDCENCRVVTR